MKIYPDYRGTTLFLRVFTFRYTNCCAKNTNRPSKTLTPEIKRKRTTPSIYNPCYKPRQVLFAAAHPDRVVSWASWTLRSSHSKLRSQWGQSSQSLPTKKPTSATSKSWLRKWSSGWTPNSTSTSTATTQRICRTPTISATPTLTSSRKDCTTCSAWMFTVVCSVPMIFSSNKWMASLQMFRQISERKPWKSRRLQLLQMRSWFPCLSFTEFTWNVVTWSIYLIGSSRLLIGLKTLIWRSFQRVKESECSKLFMKLNLTVIF